MKRSHRADRLALIAALASSGAAFAVWAPASAGNDANYVLYNQKTEARGETEIKLYSDVSTGEPGERSYGAQLLAIEYGVTDYWTSAISFEGDKISGGDYAFGGFRFENRWRLFDYGTFLNPVLFVEYEQLQPEHRYIVVVTGRTGGDELDEVHGRTTHDVESRLILAQDLSERLNVAFNWVNETSFDTGRWEFGYASGINYVLFKHEDAVPPHGSVRSWHVAEAMLGIELYGGLGDATLGLTLDPHKTQQYLGVNLLVELENKLEIGIGGAFGLTGPSEDALLRTQVGIKIE
jgi:hypothetical protein